MNLLAAKGALLFVCCFELLLYWAVALFRKNPRSMLRDIRALNVAHLATCCGLAVTSALLLETGNACLWSFVTGVVAYRTWKDGTRA